MRTVGLLWLALWAGCGAGDPCDDKSGTCVSVRLVGSVSQMDQISVEVRFGGAVILRGDSALQSPLVTLPVQFAVRFSTPTRGTVTLTVSGRRNGTTVARGSGSVVIGNTGRASLEITMFPANDLDFAVPPDLLELDAFDLRGNDLASGVTLTPSLLELGSIQIGQGTTDSFLLYNGSGRSQTITAITVDAIADYGVDPSSNCQVNGTLVSGENCTLTVVFAPTRPQSRTIRVSVELGAIHVEANMHGRSPGWYAESIASAPELYALGGTATDDIWAGGEGTLFHFGASGDWTSVTPPVGAGRITSVHAVSANELWLAASVAEIFRSLDGGASWQSAAAGAGALRALSKFGLDLYAGGDTGAIARGSFTSWTSDGNLGSAVLQFALIGTNFTALTAGVLYSRGAPAVWTPLLDLSAQAQLTSLAGTATTNYYLGGRLMPCEMGTCGVVFRQTGFLSNAVVPGCDRVNGLFYSSSTGEVWAVGQGGTVARSFGGTSFTREAMAPIATSVELRAVWERDGDLVVAGSAGTIAHRY